MKQHDITGKDGEVLVKKARGIVTEYLQTLKKPKTEKSFEEKFSFNAGVFVTLNNPVGLRGCIGLPLPNKKLFKALEEAAIAAATDDPRFPPVKFDELESITFEVTVLTPPEIISVEKPEQYLPEIRVGRDGLIVRNGFNAGLLLPQVPIEYGWNEKEFLEHACEKAGLPKDYWKNPETQVEKFRGIVFKEEKPNGSVIQEELQD